MGSFKETVGYFSGVFSQFFFFYAFVMLTFEISKDEYTF